MAKNCSIMIRVEEDLRNTIFNAAFVVGKSVSILVSNIIIEWLLAHKESLSEQELITVKRVKAERKFKEHLAVTRKNALYAYTVTNYLRRIRTHYKIQHYNNLKPNMTFVNILIKECVNAVSSIPDEEIRHSVELDIDIVKACGSEISLNNIMHPKFIDFEFDDEKKKDKGEKDGIRKDKKVL